MVVLGVAVAAVGVFGFVDGVVRFRRSAYMPDRLLKPQWLAIFVSRRVPRENVTERDVEEESSGYLMIAAGVAIVVGITMVLHG